jgi:capsid assembly protease
MNRLRNRDRKPIARHAIEAEKLFGRPWLISESALHQLVAAHQRATTQVFYDPTGGDDPDDEDRPYELSADGIATIPVKGILTSERYWRTTSYDDLGDCVDDAAANPAVRGILLSVNSPGGEVDGLFDLADSLYGARAQKPVVAIADGMCYSAAYCLASAAERLFVTRTGGTGSIGCFTTHTDYSRMLEDSGVKVTLIHSGARKVDSNPTQPLSAAAHADLQAECDRIRSLFVQTVARNRDEDEDDLFDTEAACYMADAGVPLLCDEVGNTEDALAYLRTRIQSGAARGLSRSRRQVGRGLAALPAPQQRLLGESPLTTMQFEARVFPGIRASVGSKPGSRTITMLVCPYGGAGADFGTYREVYQRGAFSKGLDGDLRVLFAHNEEHVLGRTSSGTCKFWEDESGVHATVDPPNAQWADDLLASIRRSDINQASAGFWIEKDHFEMRGSERYRVIEKARMKEASIVSWAMYESTKATVGGQAALPAASHVGGVLTLAQAQRQIDALRAQNPLSEREQAELQLERLRS